MQKKELTEKMWKEIINDFPKPVIYNWIENSSKLIEVLLAYAIGFHDGVDYVLKIARPTLKAWQNLAPVKNNS